MKTNNKKLLIAFLLIIAGVLLRVLQIAPNFSPMTAIALFGGACLLDKSLSVFITIAALFISDVLLSVMNHYPLLHDTIFFVYGAYLLIVLLGWNLQSPKNSYLKITGFAVLSSVLFFILSNFGVWLVGILYPRTFTGITNCFINAIPFYKYTFAGDVVYTWLFFGIYQLLLTTGRSRIAATSHK